MFEVSTGIPLYSFTFFFILPVGAIFAGIMAASGYYFGAITFHQKPAGGVALNMVIAAIGAYLLAHYIPYNALIVEGIQIKDKVSFFQYLDVRIQHTTLSYKGRAGGELGGIFGYLYALLQLTGFSLGGLGVFGFLHALPYCKKCSEYLKKINTQDRYTSEGEPLFENVEHFAKLLNEHKYRQAIKNHADRMGVANSKGHHLRTRITIHKCQTCTINHLDFEIARLGENGWQDIPQSQIKLWIDPRKDATVKESASP